MIAISVYVNFSSSVHWTGQAGCCAPGGGWQLWAILYKVLDERHLEGVLVWGGRTGCSDLPTYRVRLVAFVYLICFCCWYCRVATKANEPATKTNLWCYYFDFSIVLYVGSSFAYVGSLLAFVGSSFAFVDSLFAFVAGWIWCCGWQLWATVESTINHQAFGVTNIHLCFQVGHVCKY